MASDSGGDGDVQAAFAATLVDEWVRNGVTHAVVCPGSRSTPLVVALAAPTRHRAPRPSRRALGRVHRPRDREGGRPPGVGGHHQRHRRGRAAPGGGRGRSGGGAPDRLHGRPAAGAPGCRCPPDHRPDAPVRPVGAVVRRSRRARRWPPARRGARWPSRAVAESTPGTAGPRPGPPQPPVPGATAGRPGGRRGRGARAGPAASRGIGWRPVRRRPPPGAVASLVDEGVLVARPDGG